MNRDEKKLYQVNKLSYNLVMFFIILNTAHAIFTLQNMNVDFGIGIFVMMTIVLLMIGFLAAVKLQTYSLKWSYISIGIGIFQFGRYLFSPEEIVGTIKIYLDVMILLSIVFIITGAIICIIRTKQRTNYIKNEYKGNEAIH